MAISHGICSVSPLLSFVFPEFDSQGCRFVERLLVEPVRFGLLEFFNEQPLEVE